jgi:hypothetical protein
MTRVTQSSVAIVGDHYRCVQNNGARQQFVCNGGIVPLTATMSHNRQKQAPDTERRRRDL